jgi:Raf kinase inhibitor-like YbhB/YbcL family protein
MRCTREWLSRLSLLACGLAIGCGDGDSPTFQIGSDSFAERGKIPALHTCTGEGTFPGVHWDGAPERVETFALIMRDETAAIDHFAIWSIPAGATELPAGLAKVAEPMEVPGARQTQTFGGFGYLAPCPPSGTHTYTFTLLALETSLALAPGSTTGEVRQALETVAVAATTVLSGTAAR